MFRVVIFGIFIAFAFCQRLPNNNYQRANTNRFVNEPTNALTSGAAPCPERNGTFPTGACDAYIECKEGIGEEKLCPDGLLFNADARGYPCQYPIDVDCTGRAATQPPQSTADCPRQFGYFRLGDAAHCGQFTNCAAGRAFTFDCPEGLAFNAATYRCDWPDQVPDCDAEAFLGFTCPPPPPPDSFFGHGEEFRFHASPADCQHYFVCIAGRPRMYNCGEGQAFNQLTNTCDGAENVTGCATQPPIYSSRG